MGIQKQKEVERVTLYEIVTGDISTPEKEAEFVIEVRGLIDIEWQPFGPPMLNGNRIVQAMVW